MKNKRFVDESPLLHAIALCEPHGYVTWKGNPNSAELLRLERIGRIQRITRIGMTLFHLIGVESPLFRMRRGKMVQIPPQWIGKFPTRKTLRQRRLRHKIKPTNAKRTARNTHSET